MKPKTLVLSVLAVLLLAVAAWQLADRGEAEAVHAPLPAAADAPPAPSLPEPETAAATVQPVTAPTTERARPPIKRTVLPNGQVITENRPVTLRHADGRIEERLVRMIARPVTMPAPVRRGKAGLTPGENPSAPPTDLPTGTMVFSGAQVSSDTTSTSDPAADHAGTPGTGDASEGDASEEPADESAEPPKTDG